MEQKFNFKTIGVVMVWIGIIVATMYFLPIGKIISALKPDGKSSASGLVNAVLKAGHYEYDFGTISMANGKVRHSYPLKNEGSEALNMDKVWTSCMCTIAEIKTQDGKIYGPFGMAGHGGNTSADIDIAPGQEFELTVEFDPNAHGPEATGPIQRVVYVKTNASKEPLGLSFMANVVK